MSRETYYPDGRFRITDTKREVENPFDMSSELLTDMQRRNIEPFFSKTLNLATASKTQFPSNNGALEIQVPGKAMVIYGFDNTNASTAVIRTVNSAALIWVSFNNPLPFNPADDANATSVVNLPGAFPMKHSRGVRFPFIRAYLYWPAQANVGADIIIHRYKYEPWVNGESAT